jgi:hypothetical protein
VNYQLHVPEKAPMDRRLGSSKISLGTVKKKKKNLAAGN